MGHSNISVFVPHIGCPHMCAFCNQRTITGTEKIPHADDVKRICTQAMNEVKDVSQTEIAFFGGSFTAVPREYMLEVWTERAGVDIIKHNEGSDPASVVFDALAAAKARQADVVICDTAGRLHNKKNLMDELKKISRIVHQQAEGCALEVLLALDATTGQNAVNQARQFNEVADITGIILTKLDGTAKGGIIISITDDLQVPFSHVLTP